MKRNLWIPFAIALLALVAGGFWLYNWVLGDPLAASQPISAIPVQVDTQTPVSLPEPTATSAAQDPLPTDPPADPPAAQANAQASDGMLILSIVPEESQASFTIYEQLNGQDKNVVGKTSQVAGEVAINPADLSQIQFGPIQVNARALVTDDNRRNNAIRNRILHTDQYEFVTFTPTALTGLSGAGSVGQLYNFQVSGDLTIQNVTQPVTFDVTLQAESDSRLSGTATTTITRSDYQISIPSVPFVANVGEEVTLELQFVMVPTSR